VLLVGAVLAFLYLPAIGSFSTRALSYSVTKEAGGSVIAGPASPCRRTEGRGNRNGERRYRCSIGDSGGSGGAMYTVRVEGRCWKARRVRDFGFEGELKRRVEGCVRWRDQLRLFDRI
jgi:hypothetical protein